MNLRLFLIANSMLLLGVLSLGLVGCGEVGEQAPAGMVALSGTVTMDDKPLEGAMVSFIPLDASAVSHSFSGRTNAEGKYQLQGPANSLGALPGKYKVTISRILLPSGQPIPEDSEHGPMGMGGAMETIPSEYSMWNQTSLAHEVPAAGGTADFKLKGRADVLKPANPQRGK